MKHLQGTEHNPLPTGNVYTYTAVCTKTRQIRAFYQNQQNYPEKMEHAEFPVEHWCGGFVQKRTGESKQ